MPGLDPGILFVATKEGTRVKPGCDERQGVLALLMILPHDPTFTSTTFYAKGPRELI